MSLATSITIGLTTAGLLAYAGHVTRRRTVTPDARAAVLAFSVWWYGAALVILNQALRTILAMSGVDDVHLYTTLAQAGNAPLAAALGGLLYYILYLMTGRHALLAPVIVLYAFYLGYISWYTARAGERRLEIGEWQAQLVGGSSPSPAETVVFGLLLAAPVLLTVGAYTVFAFRAPGRTQRFRLTIVSGGFLFLFSMILVGFLLGWNDEPWFPLAYQLPALLLSLLVVLAYRPPAWLQLRLGVEAVPAKP